MIGVQTCALPISIFQVLPSIFRIFQLFQCFSQYSRSYSVCVSFSTFFSVSTHNPILTVCVSHFPWFSVFSPYSRSYSVYLSFFMFFRTTLTYFTSYSVCLSFSMVSVFSTHSRSYIIHVSVSRFLNVSLHTSRPTVCISHFPPFSVFLAIFHVKQCLCLIFHII